jgi:hypothetical protein
VTITLPPLPEPVYTFDEDGNKVFYEKAALVRARDLEVARLVLEGAIGACCHLAQADAVSHLLRALEVQHHE